MTDTTPVQSPGIEVPDFGSPFLVTHIDGRVLHLRVDPRSYWIYTNSPGDNARVEAALRAHGFDGGLDRLSASA